MPKVFRFVIDELLHAQPDEDKNRRAYHMKILNTILETGSTRQFIYALTDLIKRLAVDHLHIIGDIYDRGLMRQDYGLSHAPSFSGYPMGKPRCLVDGCGCRQRSLHCQCAAE